MRLILGLCALAISGSAVGADVGRHASDVCAKSEQHRVRPRRQGADSLHLSRRQAIAEALTRNAQIEIAREQTAKARARRVTAIAIPDPTLTAGFDQETSPFAFGGAPSRPVGWGSSLPSRQVPAQQPYRTRRHRASESNYRLQQQTIALQASATYDSLLVALIHRREPARRTAARAAIS